MFFWIWIIIDSIICILLIAGGSRPSGSHAGTGMWPPPAPPHHFDRSTLPANLRASTLPRPEDPDNPEGIGKPHPSRHMPDGGSLSSRPTTDGERPPSRHAPDAAHPTTRPAPAPAPDGERPPSRHPPATDVSAGPRLGDRESRPRADTPPGEAVQATTEGGTENGESRERDAEEGEVLVEMEDGESPQPSSSEFGRLALTEEQQQRHHGNSTGPF